MNIKTSIARIGWLNTMAMHLAACAVRLLPVLLLLALPAAVQAQFTYTTNNGTITITGYTGSGGDVNIPSTINGYPVTSIGTWAFDGASLTSVLIGTNVTRIGTNAFSNCHSLTSVTIPGSVTSIGNSAFMGCGLTIVTIGSNVTSIGEGTFSWCNSLTAINVDTNNLTYSSLAGVLFNKSQTTLIEYSGGVAVSYPIPTGVTSIAGSAFGGCINLTTVTIPASVISIGGGAFGGCQSLSVITVETNNPNYSSLAGVLFDKNVTTLIQCPEGIAGSYTIPTGVTTIEVTAFNFCLNLTNITIPDSVINIGIGVFRDCASLTAITVDPSNPAYRTVAGVLFDKNVTTLIQCPTGIAGSYTIPTGVTTIWALALSGCGRLTNVTIPNSVTDIGGYAFDTCGSLTSVTIPGSVTTIGDGAFGGCGGLTSVTIGSNVTNIGNATFGGDTSLTGVYFQGNFPSLGSSVFAGDNNATVYYLPGKTGWDQWVSPPPAVLWKPQVQTSVASFGVRTNQFGFNITWASGMTVVVVACTNLANPNWLPVHTNILTGGSAYFSDPKWTNYPARFYRLRSR